MENIKITGLCQDCFNWAKCHLPFKNNVNSCFEYKKPQKLEKDKSDFETHVNFVDEQLIKRIGKLEKDYGSLDEVFNEFNLRDLKVHTDFEGRIKELETKVGMKHISVTDNAEQTKDCHLSPQAKNTLNAVQVDILIKVLSHMRLTDWMIITGLGDIDRDYILTKLESYLEE